MTLQEFYEAVGGNYEESMRRLMNDTIARRFLVKFLDAEDYPKMVEAFENKDYDNAFLYSHNLKGVALNLGMDALGNAAGELCETVRGGKEPVPYPDALLEQVGDEYRRATEAIRCL
ncbi:MAG: Hpt domain-containing protein [Clostridia bacterium]|nr:Hpt domain-containing protein [Clostridia bacterium]